MARLCKIGIALLVSAVFYIGVNGWLLEKRLSHGLIGDALQIKREYAQTQKPPRIFIAGGSNVFYSFKCAAIAETIGQPCINYGTSFDIGLPYTLELIERDTRPGDTLVLAFEYYTYFAPMDALYRGLSHPIRLTHDSGSIFNLDLDVALHAIFQFDMRYMAGAFVESALDILGIKRLITRKQITPMGDVTGMSLARTEYYQAKIENDRFDIHRGQVPFQVGPAATEIFSEGIERLKAKDVTIIATLPTLAEGYGLTPDVYSAIEGAFAKWSVPVVVLPNYHVYPINCFFDTHYHLNEPCQLEHSRAFAKMLAKAMKK